MLESGHVILPRLFFRDWEWSDDANTVAVFLRLLIEADIVPNTWHGIEVPRGGMVSNVGNRHVRAGRLNYFQNFLRLRPAQYALYKTGRENRAVL